TGALAGKQSRSGGIRRFRASIEQPLHAYTDSKKGLTGCDRLQHSFAQPRIERLAARKVSHTGDQKLFSGGDSDGIGSHFSSGAKMIQCLLDRADIARAVVDNGNHNSPLVLGNIRASCLSREQATRKARAKALKRDSIL